MPTSDNCSRCNAGLPNIHEHASLDRCAECCADLCESCMDDGCCGHVPAKSWADVLAWQGRDPAQADLTPEEYVDWLRGSQEW